MPLPDAPRVIYRRNPLVEVICQLRFPTILAIATEVPTAFQDRVRARYPLYALEDPSTIIPKEIAALVAQFAPQGALGGRSHKFSSADDEGTAITLNRDFVAVTDSNYKRWEDFRAAAELAESTLQDVYHPAFYSRVGLRYRDVIVRSDLGLSDVDWDRLLSPPLAGLLAAEELRGDVLDIVTEALVGIREVDGAHAKIRHGIVRPTTDPNAEPAYSIDIDFFVEGKHTHDHAFATLAVFNRLARNLFQWSITPELARALDPEPVDEVMG